MISAEHRNDIKNLILEKVQKAKFVCGADEHEADIKYKIERENYLEFIFVMPAELSKGKNCTEVYLLQTDGKVCFKRNVNIGRGEYDLNYVYKISLENLEG